MIEQHIQQEILNRIQKAEQQYNVKVLYAIESGSRAWGFASPNSDYDVRFIYAHPKDWYLSIDVEHQRDVIEYPIVDEIDINGWDIRKALQLLKKSNPSIVEWLHSPIVYIDDQHFAPKARALLQQTYSIEKGIYHYRSMAQGNFKTHISKEGIRLKKYLYILRALLTVQWLEKYQSIPPIEFEKLRCLIAGTPLDQIITELLQRKKQSLEKELIAPIPELNQFIEGELERLASYKDAPQVQQINNDEFNQLFREVLATQK